MATIGYAFDENGAIHEVQGTPGVYPAGALAAAGLSSFQPTYGPFTPGAKNDWTTGYTVEQLYSMSLTERVAAAGLTLPEEVIDQLVGGTNPLASLESPLQATNPTPIGGPIGPGSGGSYIPVDFDPNAGYTPIPQTSIIDPGGAPHLAPLYVTTPTWHELFDYDHLTTSDARLRPIPFGGPFGLGEQ